MMRRTKQYVLDVFCCQPPKTSVETVGSNYTDRKDLCAYTAHAECIQNVKYVVSGICASYETT
jgi:hypothetical protein